MVARMREKGQITIPNRIRDQLRLSKDSLLSVAKVGDAILLAPQPSTYEEVARKFESRSKKAGITLPDLLKELRKERHPGS